MANLGLSPEVNVDEIDLTLHIAAVATSTGAFVGSFNWGPCFEIRTIGKIGNLALLFGRPDDTNYTDFFTAYNFLLYSNNLKVIRAVDLATAKNSTTDGSGLLIKNRDDYRLNYSSGEASAGIFAAKWPGVRGNSLFVSLCGVGAGYNSIMTSTVTCNSGNAILSFSGNTKSDATRPLQIHDYIRIGANTDWLEVININQYGNTVTVNTGNIVISAVANTVVGKWKFADYFDSAPGTSDYVRNRGGSNDDVHIIVVDRYGKFAPVPNTVLERFGFTSVASDARRQANGGVSDYYRDVLDTRSQHIWWIDHPSSGTNWGNTANATSFTTLSKPEYYMLAGGSDGTPSDGALISGWDMFQDKEQIDVSLLMTANSSQVVKKYVLENIAQQRGDCVVFMGPNREDVLFNGGEESSDIISYRSYFPSSSYGFFVDNWKYQYDPYNASYRWLPLDGDIAGLAARTDNDLDTWWSFAGYNRGQIKSVVKLAWNSTKTDRDDMYRQGINSVVNFPGEGIILFGDRTMLLRPSAFDRINVRRLFITLEKAISAAAKYSLFEFNDAFTRAQFVNLVEPYLRDVQGRRGIYDFRVICDETNNTPFIIDNNQFVGTILIKPARSINWIDLNFVAVGTGVDFTSELGFGF